MGLLSVSYLRQNCLCEIFSLFPSCTLYLVTGEIHCFYFLYNILRYLMNISIVIPSLLSSSSKLWLDCVVYIKLHTSSKFKNRFCSGFFVTQNLYGLKLVKSFVLNLFLCKVKNKTKKQNLLIQSSHNIFCG